MKISAPSNLLRALPRAPAQPGAPAARDAPVLERRRGVPSIPQQCLAGGAGCVPTIVTSTSPHSPPLPLGRLPRDAEGRELAPSAGRTNVPVKYADAAASGAACRPVGSGACPPGAAVAVTLVETAPHPSPSEGGAKQSKASAPVLFKEPPAAKSDVSTASDLEMYNLSALRKFARQISCNVQKCTNKEQVVGAIAAQMWPETPAPEAPKAAERPGRPAGGALDGLERETGGGCEEEERIITLSGKR
jgi:hypothetical protein